MIPVDYQGKRVVLEFESCRMRAEVYLNNQLVAYDIINGTPFSVDISDFADYGKKNQLAVRITDANGNFLWCDFKPFNWGRIKTPPSHGFGGITGKVTLSVTDNIYIKDVFVKNRPEMTSVDVEVTMGDVLGSSPEGELSYVVHEWQHPERVIHRQRSVIEAVDVDAVVVHRIAYPKAKLWSPETPNLYVLTVSWKGADGTMGTLSRRFGFRWFDVNEVAGDKMFFLNGKRILLVTSISWGFWPENGIFPTSELARKQIRVAKEFGLNCLNFHRGIGQPELLDLADEMGLLYYEEPGGYKTNHNDFLKKWNREKLMRMIVRDRNHPSLVIYNMINESNREPFENEWQDIKDAHRLDETRIITFTSTNFFKKNYGGSNPLDSVPIKLHMLPYNHDTRIYGWWDEHHPDGPGVYLDNFYNGPKDFHKNSNNLSEIVFWGEEGAIGTPDRLALMVEEIERKGLQGWDSHAFVAQYEGYDRFLKEKGFLDAFPGVDSLTKALGEVSFYYQGRMIENIRISNTVDGYAVNGWESEKIENHSGIVDVFRNPKADPGIIARYNQPLYLAVKIRDKVLPVGDTSVVDFFIINEKGLIGNYVLFVEVTDRNGRLFSKNLKVYLKGGWRYGQLLLEGLEVPVRTDGYVTVRAQLFDKKVAIAKGDDQIFSTRIPSEKLQPLTVLDTTGVVQEMLKLVGVDYVNYEPEGTIVGDLVVGHWSKVFDQGAWMINNNILDWISSGNRLIILDDTDQYCDYLRRHEVVGYRGSMPIRKNWYGGNYFVKDDPFFDGLPVACAFNWEYQSLATYHDRQRLAMRLSGERCVVGANVDHQPELFSVVGVVPHGNGEVVISALDLKASVLSKDKSSVVAKRIFWNILRH